MLHVECPWCAGPATIEGDATSGDQFSCADCMIGVEVATAPVVDVTDLAA